MSEGVLLQSKQQHSVQTASLSKVDSHSHHHHHDHTVPTRQAHQMAAAAEQQPSRGSHGILASLRQNTVVQALIPSTSEHGISTQSSSNKFCEFYRVHLKLICSFQFNLMFLCCMHIFDARIAKLGAPLNDTTQIIDAMLLWVGKGSREVSIKCINSHPRTIETVRFVRSNHERVHMRRNLRSCLRHRQHLYSRFPAPPRCR